MSSTPVSASEPREVVSVPTRREVLARVTMLLGGTALAGGSALVIGCAGAQERERIAAEGMGDFSASDVACLEEIADTILPETGTPGAKAARTGAFMALMVTDAYTEQNQQVFRAGMQTLDDACRQQQGVDFMTATPAQRLALLEAIDREQHEYMAARPADDPPHYFRLMKELALLGYFTSEIGYTQAMRYVESPGRFDPCVPYAPGERSWAPHA